MIYHTVWNEVLRPMGLTAGTAAPIPLYSRHMNFTPGNTSTGSSANSAADSFGHTSTTADIITTSSINASDSGSPASDLSRQAMSGALPQLDDLHTLYHLAFEAGNVCSNTASTQLLQVLLAAQEPLPQSLLQQMGLDEALQQLPGYGVLFFAAEHHVYLLHKSLSDWLLQQSFVDVSQGHLELGLHMAEQNLSRPTPYMLKYLTHHLVSAALPQAYAKLDSVLQAFDFVGAVCLGGCKHRLVESLSRLPSNATTLGWDMLCWLRTSSHELDQVCDVAVQLAAHCPVTSKLFRVAESKLSGTVAGWRLHDAFGRSEWESCFMVLGVSLGQVKRLLCIPSFL